MNCGQIQELLSAYLDGELAEQPYRAVAEHLDSCPDCAGELAGFRSLSVMARQLTASPTPSSNWDQLERVLDADSVAPLRGEWRWRILWQRGWLIAATLLLTIGLGWTGYYAMALHHKHSRVFGHYLQNFERDPVMAQEMLLAKYQGKSVDAEDAIHTVGYQPATASGLPEGYSIESTYVMNMPCCTCFQTVCKRDDGSVLVVFEHDDEQSNWFGARPSRVANCGGKQCSLVGLDSQLAASWKRGSRYLTIIGAKDVAEVEKMVSWLDESGKRPA